ncbi:MAG TPA: hypothetical protein VMP01_09395, partial [Pirellulaceae bacterium]|nr:hypothetical protein [Pirellulaceae bacterium]
ALCGAERNAAHAVETCCASLVRQMTNSEVVRWIAALTDLPRRAHSESCAQFSTGDGHLQLRSATLASTLKRC